MTTYSMVKKRYSTTALRSLRFVPDGSRMVKRGACRRELAEATSWQAVPPNAEVSGPTGPRNL